jgi:hypothetical protein
MRTAMDRGFLNLGNYQRELLMSSSDTPVEKDYDPVKNPRPEDLHAYGIGRALIWFAGLLALLAIVYWIAF